jgi:hypothetical protein
MKAKEPGGRFDLAYERRSILSGITEDLRIPVGQTIDWWRWDPTDTVVDNVYDVGSINGGRLWYPPIKLPCVNAVIFQGVSMQNERGFYNTDVMRITINMEDVEKLIPTVLTITDSFLKDRIVYRGQVFRPTHFYPRGLIKDKYTLLTLDASQINSEELVNDSQFQAYSSVGLGYGYGYGEKTYGYGNYGG